jgi:hypothetical protein
MCEVGDDDDGGAWRDDFSGVYELRRDNAADRRRQDGIPRVLLESFDLSVD